MILRRTWLISALGMVAASVLAYGQSPPRVFRIGLLGGSNPASEESRHVWAPFFRELQERGWVQSQNIEFEGRYYGDRLEQLPAFAAELVRLNVDLIVAAAAPAPEAARRATSTIPIVMPNHFDPVGSGLAASLARPGGNVTGLSMLARDLRAKQLQLLKETLPGLTSVAFLRHPDIPFEIRELEVAARLLGLDPRVVEARTPDEIETAFSTVTRQRAGAVAVLAGSMFFAHRTLIAELAIRRRLPTVYALREHAEAGGLMTYGVDLRENFRRAAGYVDRILRGARPGDLPIEQPTKFELVINLKTAHALGLGIPRAVLARADQVIE